MASPDQVIASRPGGHRRLFAGLAFLLIPAVALLTMLPESDKRVLHTRGRFHSAGHFLVFGLVAFVAVRSARTVHARVLLFAGVLAFSFGTEVAEHFSFGGAVEWKDVAVDGCGVLAGGTIALLTLMRWSRSSSSRGAALR